MFKRLKDAVRTAVAKAQTLAPVDEKSPPVVTKDATSQGGLLQNLKDGLDVAKALAEPAKQAMGAWAQTGGVAPKWLPSTSPKLIFAMDATASRGGTWAVASELNEAMLSAAGDAGLSVAIGYFNGSHCGVTDGYFTSTAAASGYLKSIGLVSDVTKIARLFGDFLSHAKSPYGARVAIFVGDAFEDDFAEAMSKAELLKQHGFRVFMLLEGRGGEVAQRFKQLAEATGGLSAEFADVNKLRELVQSVAAYAAGTLALAAPKPLLPPRFKPCPRPRAPELRKHVNRFMCKHGALRAIVCLGGGSLPPPRPARILRQEHGDFRLGFAAKRGNASGGQGHGGGNLRGMLPSAFSGESTCKGSVPAGGEMTLQER